MTHFSAVSPTVPQEPLLHPDTPASTLNICPCVVPLPLLDTMALLLLAHLDCAGFPECRPSQDHPWLCPPVAVTSRLLACYVPSTASCFWSSRPCTSPLASQSVGSSKTAVTVRLLVSLITVPLFIECPINGYFLIEE